MYNAGKPKSEICREYDLVSTVVDRWARQINATGSTKERDNWTTEERQIIRLRKENQQLERENDILKQAVLLFEHKLK